MTNGCSNINQGAGGSKGMGGVVDFHDSFTEAFVQFLSSSGVPIYYPVLN